jgi:hypothetical protein
VIDRTIAFIKEALRPDYQAALGRAVPEASAAAHVMAGNSAEAAAAHAEPASRFAEACDELGKLKGKGLGPRDLGIPAARACMQKGDADAAIEWLRSIPKRFRLTQLRDDPIFAPIRTRPELLDLF